jgi:hypothetical protein
MAENNTVELIVKIIDEATAPITNLIGGLDHLSKSLLGLSLGQLGGFAGVAAGIKLFISESSEAQDATVRLDRLYNAFSKTIGVTRQELRNFAEQTGRTSRFSTAEITGMQATLVRFGSLTGDTLRQAEQATVGLGIQLGNLGQASMLVSRALANPEQSTRMLMMAGIKLEPVQQRLIKQFMELGQQAKADQVILDELMKRYGKAATEDLNTFSGAWSHLKNSFKEMFDLQGPLASFTSAINLLADGFQKLLPPDPAKRVDELKKKLKELTDVLNIRQAGGAPVGGLQSQIAALNKELLAAQWENFRVNRGNLGAGNASDRMEEVTVVGDPKKAEKAYKDAAEAAKKAVEDQKQLMEDYKKLLDQYNEDTMTALEKEQEAWHIFDNKVGLQVAEREITAEEGAKRRKERTDEMLQEIQPTVHMIQLAKQPLDELSKQQIQAVKNIQDAFAAAFMSIGHGIRGMADAFLNAIKNMVAQALAANLTQALFGSIDPATGARSGGSSWGSAILQAGTMALFAGLAEGGTTGGGPVWVGEKGPELLVPPAGSQVFNRSQLSGMGGGMNYAPITNIVIQPKDGDVASIRQEFYSAMEMNNKKQKSEIYDTMYRNRLGRMR